ncbi:MAG: phosphoribosylglycinamide synthetase C domain-containing protein, partial [Oscillospiraceae bacterium]
FSPSRIYNEELANECMTKIFLPTMEAMKAENRTFKGVLYFGLIQTSEGVKVIEYNCRFGDPETQVVLPRLKTDVLEILLAVCGEKLAETEIEWSDAAAACVVMASGGYPEKYAKGMEIVGLNEKGQLDGVVVYHAGTKVENGRLYTNGGRVLGVTALGDTLEEALEKSYAAVQKISFPGAHYRSDIGK